MTAAIDLAGHVFGQLSVIRRDFSRPRRAHWLCKCECGGTSVVSSDRLRSGKTTSCGCYKRANSTRNCRIHGASPTSGNWPEYGVWATMKNRCYRESTKKFVDYGARGIRVCDRWLVGEGGVHPFLCFIADMGRRPTSKHSIERKNNDGNYEPDNCCWATATVQANNRRKRK